MIENLYDWIDTALHWIGWRHRAGRVLDRRTVNNRSVTTFIHEEWRCTHCGLEWFDVHVIPHTWKW